MKTSRRSGFSLIEVVIAAALIGLIAALMYGFMSGATNQYSNDQSRETLYQTARRLLDQIANELRDANPDAIFVPGDTTYPVSIRFQRAKEWDVTTQKMTWSDEIVYGLTSSPVDANGNRASDDWGILRVGPPEPTVTTSQSVMVCHYVKAGGFTIAHDLATNRISLSLTLTSSKPGETAMEITVTTSVLVRSNKI